MKKKLIFIILLGLLIAVLFLIPKDTYAKIFGKGNSQDDNINVSGEPILVYMCNDKNQIVGVNAYVASVEEDAISQKFDILTKKTGTFNDTYTTTINTNTSLVSYETENNILTLNLTEDFLNSEGRKTIEQMVWTFCDDEINELVINVNDQKINSLNGFNFDNITKDLGINITCETSYLFEANHTTIIEYLNECILPVTYFYLDMEACDFIVSKLFDSEIVVENGYDYVLSENSVIIDVSSNNLLSENLKKSLEATFNYNLNISNITVQGIDQVLLEIKTEN